MGNTLPSFTGINICKLNILHAIEGSKKKDFKTSWRVIIHYTLILYHGFFICSKKLFGGKYMYI